MEARSTALDKQVDMLASVIEAAFKFQEDAKAVTSNLDATSKQFDSNIRVAVEHMTRLSNDLPRHVTGQVNTLLKDAAIQAADAMSQQWGKANTAAANAAKVYEDSVVKANAYDSSARYRTLIIFSLGVGFGCVITALLVFVFLPRI